MTMAITAVVDGLYSFGAVWVVFATLYTLRTMGKWQNVVDSLERAWRNIQPHAERVARVFSARAKRAGTAALRRGESLAKGAHAGFLRRPHLWGGVIAASLGVYYFGSAFSQKDWMTFHVGMFWAVVSFILFAIHFNWIEKMWNFTQKHPVGVWLTVSATSLAVTLGHGWAYGTVISFLSLACAIITIAGWWGWVGTRATEILFTAKYDVATPLFAWSAICFLPCLVILLDSELANEYMDVLRVFGGLSALLGCFGIGRLTWKISDKAVDKMVK